MVRVGLEPLEPPSEYRNRIPSMPLALVSGVLPEPGSTHKAGSVGIIFTLWNTMMGSTLLVMPYTFNQAGWLLALGLSVICAIIAQFTCNLILVFGEGMMADPSAEFADLALLHFGYFGKLLAFLTGNLVVTGAAVAMHGYMATVLSHLIAYTPMHGGFCSAAATVGPVASFANATASALLETADNWRLGSGDESWQPRPDALVSPCLAGLVKTWPPVNKDAPAPLLVLAVLIVVFPLANLPSIKMLARLNTVGVLCFMIILGFSYASAGVAGIEEKAFDKHQMVKPASAGIVFGIFSLSFFIHNAVMTIMRGAAEPRHNQRDLVVAFFLVWLCYASMGVAANVCPPLHNLEALSSVAAKNGLLSLEQPPKMAPLLIVARLAVLAQCMSVYPVLLFIVRSQLFTFFMHRPYPGPLPTLMLSIIQATITTSFTALGVDIADVLKFAGAGGGLVCCFGMPALIYGKVHARQGTLTWVRLIIVIFLCVYGILCVLLQVVPFSLFEPHGNGTAPNGTIPQGNGTEPNMTVAYAA